MWLTGSCKIVDSLWSQNLQIQLQTHFIQLFIRYPQIQFRNPQATMIQPMLNQFDWHSLHSRLISSCFAKCVSSVASFESNITTSFVNHFSCWSSIQLLYSVWEMLLGVEDIALRVVNDTWVLLCIELECLADFGSDNDGVAFLGLTLLEGKAFFWFSLLIIEMLSLKGEKIGNSQSWIDS